MIDTHSSMIMSPSRGENGMRKFPSPSTPYFGQDTRKKKQVTGTKTVPRFSLPFTRIPFFIQKLPFYSHFNSHISYSIGPTTHKFMEAQGKWSLAVEII